MVLRTMPGLKASLSDLVGLVLAHALVRDLSRGRQQRRGMDDTGHDVCRMIIGERCND